ncbi:putative bacteriophage protein [Xanthobacter versatilis]|uniref:Putative bacteriophage protein n=1 Tax=Xanthobacter autotrophicus (strain ATCC BAA-1158 / Py2) TaxID=78245 RepID=A7ILH3_XANP2|nr:putative bacteriophage protein [Xanthobacter autotrophicus Py2]
MNDSSTGGYLAPSGPVAQDAALEDQIQAAIVGITGLSGPRVKPAWQPNPPAKEDLTVDWCAYRITSIDPNWTGAIVHHPEGEGTDELRRHETVEVLCNFYGPNASAFACVFRDGLLIPQNMETLQAQGIAFLEAGAIRAAPDFVNNQWVQRQDLLVRFRRMTSRTYQIRNVLSAEGVFVVENGNTNSWNTENT